jgi:hypothetical protein
MKNNARAQMRDEDMPQFEVVSVKAETDAAISRNLSTPLVLPSSIRIRRPRAELNVLGWENRAARLSVRK